jgi:hypothetical protein
MKEYEAVLQNQPMDVSEEFARQQNHFFIGSEVLEFDPSAAFGRILWKGRALKQRVSYHQLTLQFEDYKVWEDLPPGEFEDDQDFCFSISFITPRTVLLRVTARPDETPNEPSLMLDGDPPTDGSWEMSDDGLSAAYEGRFGSVSITRDPVRFEFRDALGRLASENGHPMLRALFFEYPEDPTSWFIEDEYLFGTDILVAPLMEDVPSRNVYLPPGLWTDYQTGATYKCAGWHHIRAGEIPTVMLVRYGAAIPHIRLAQSTEWMNWSEIELVVYGTSTAEGPFCLPEGRALHTLRLEREGDGFVLKEDPLEGEVGWNVRAVTGRRDA